MVTRNAIIISCPGKGDDYLTGANKDLQNISNYLLSPRGGAWKENEIIRLNNPTWAEVKATLDHYTADYQFIYFAGHGCSDENKKRYLAFKDQNIEDIRLLTHNPRQLIVADACRVHYATIAGIPPAEDVFSYFTGETDARRTFDSEINRSAYGKMIIHATQHNAEAKEERYGRGGMFTLSLLRTAMDFNTTKNLSPVVIADLLPIVQATLRSQENKQIPEITYETGNLNVPFLIDTDQSVMEEILVTQPQIPYLKIISIALVAILLLKKFSD